MAVDINVLKDFLGVQAIEVIQLRSEKVRLEKAVAEAEPRIKEMQQRIAALVHQDDPQEEAAAPEQPAAPPVVEVSEADLKRAIAEGQAEYEANMQKVRRIARDRAA